MSKRGNITDERLNEMLASMKSERDITAEENLKPPVINAYRLEKERLRRQKRIQVAVTSIAAAISLILMTVCGFVLKKIYSHEIDKLIYEFRRSEAYEYIEKFITTYDTEIKFVFISILLLLVLCYTLGTVLLVKNKDKLLHSHQH